VTIFSFIIFYSPSYLLIKFCKTVFY